MNSIVILFASVISLVFGSAIIAQIPESCPENEEPTGCVNPCLATCVKPFVPCDIWICYPGCACKAGYIRTAPGGPCVVAEDCGGYCNANQEYSSCGSACPGTCTSDPNAPCIEECVQGCFCKKDYILKSLSGECVSKSECPSPANQTITE